MKLLTAVAVFMLLLSGLAIAQDKPQEQPAAGAQAMPPMGPPQPTPEMEKYIKMAKPCLIRGLAACR